MELVVATPVMALINDVEEGGDDVFAHDELAVATSGFPDPSDDVLMDVVNGECSTAELLARAVQRAGRGAGS